VYRKRPFCEHLRDRSRTDVAEAVQVRVVARFAPSKIVPKSDPRAKVSGVDEIDADALANGDEG
jgi:hypothetical protein